MDYLIQIFNQNDGKGFADNPISILCYPLTDNRNNIQFGYTVIMVTDIKLSEQYEKDKKEKELKEIEKIYNSLI